jgi:energy-coupling factor transporter ATP-binding protein EcfA2
VLELIDLSRRYGETIALEGLSFTVEPGQLFGFVGPNGAGKTTAMRIVLGVLEPDRGEVRWEGRQVDAAMRRRFGYMPGRRSTSRSSPRATGRVRWPTQASTSCSPGAGSALRRSPTTSSSTRCRSPAARSAQRRHCSAAISARRNSVRRWRRSRCA